MSSFQTYTPKKIKLERQIAALQRTLKEHFSDSNHSTNLYQIIHSMVRIIEIELYSSKGEKRGAVKKQIILDHFKAYPQIGQDSVSGMIDALCEHLENPGYWLRARRFLKKLFPGDGKKHL